jgi:hypothetical protein
LVVVLDFDAKVGAGLLVAHAVEVAQELDIIAVQATLAAAILTAWFTVRPGLETIREALSRLSGAAIAATRAGRVVLAAVALTSPAGRNSLIMKHFQYVKHSFYLFFYSFFYVKCLSDKNCNK